MNSKSMKTLAESVVTAMDGTDPEILPYLPYILQDIWEIGTDPATIIRIIRKHCTGYDTLKVLDLGCGKGAISVQLTQTLGCHCHGIDAVPDFIAFAEEKSREFGVDHLCRFETGDIRHMVSGLSGYSIIILGSIGPVFGDFLETLNKLNGCINEGGLFIIDSGYIEDSSEFQHPMIQKQGEIYHQIRQAGMRLIAEEIYPRDSIVESDNRIFDHIVRRCRELIILFPENREMFEDYLRNQDRENDVLENKMTCSTLVIGAVPGKSFL